MLTTSTHHPQEDTSMQPAAKFWLLYAIAMAIVLVLTIWNH
jgi:hypothetical protein